MYSTRRPGGGWARTSNYSDYGNVVSNYAVALQQALQAQAQTELESKVFNYKNGTLSYTDLKKFLNDRLAGELAGSQKELDLRQLLSEVDTYENTKNRDIERSKLEARYSKGGISAAERVQIENDLLKFYKQGTPEYSEQLSVISQAKELQRQEAKNERVAELEGKLSEGGLSTAEQIQVMEEARSLSDKGTREYSEYTAKIGLLKDQKREEDMMQKRNEAVSKLLDQFAPDGWTNEELLQINRTEQQFTEPGSEEYIKLKEQEGNILGDISSDGARAGEDVAKEEAAIAFLQAKKQLDQLDAMFSSGEITAAEYIQQQEELTQVQQENVGVAKVSAEQQAELLNRINNVAEMKNKINSKSGVVTVDKNGNQRVYDRADAGIAGKVEKVFWGEDDEVGKDLKVVTILDEENNPKEYFVNENGELEEVGYAEDGERVRTSKFYGDSDGGSGDTMVQKESPSAFTQIQRKVEGVIPRVGEVLGSKSGGSGAASRVSGMQKSSSISKGSSSKSKSSGSSSNVAKAVSSAYTAVKKSTTTGNQYKSAPVVAKVGKVTVKKGNIKGTVDFGITEKVSSAAKKAKNKIKSLFK